MNETNLMLTISILGGTGKEGKGLAYRWAKAGYRVLIGSRSPEKAIAAAAELQDRLGNGHSVHGTGNLDAAQQGNIIVLTVPYSAHRETLETVKPAIQGKMLIDVTVPLVPPKVSTAQMPAAGSAALEAVSILGKDCPVTTAFQNISHELLLGDSAIACDVLVTGTSKDARQETLKLVHAAGLTGWDAGPIENSMVVEGLTSVLIHINKRYASTHAGIRIVGVDEENPA